MKQTLFSFGGILVTAIVAFALSGCSAVKYSDGTTAGVCIGLMCPINSAMGLNGDAGRNPNADFKYASKEFDVGKDSRATVLLALGNPTATGTLKLNDGYIVKLNYYAHSDTAAEPSEPGVSPTKVWSFYFDKEDKLIGQQYSSSYKTDSTDFDESKQSQIVKGKSTKADVAQLMGEPTAYLIPPIDKAIIYSYSPSTKGSDGKLITKAKVLKVALDEHDVVTNITYTTSTK